MCGIFAAVSDRPRPPLDLDPILDALASRGPDGRGVWRGDNVVLGHTRLAIVDRTGGEQPVANEDDTVVAVVNGEIYEAACHRRWLEARGHRVRSRCDSELLVHLYEELGDAMVERLTGELAFVLLDRRRERVVAGRDRFGIKPLHVAQHDGRWLLASRAKALVAAGVPVTMNEEAVTTALCLHYPPAGATLFSGIDAIPPGTLWIWERGAVRTSRWGGAEGGAAFASTFDAAVASRLVADVPIAVQLSGGIDSAAVLATASEHRRQTAFTVSFPGRAEDERSLAEATASHLGASLQVVEATPAALAAAWPAAVAAGEGLAVNAHLPAKWLLGKAVREAGFRVVLTGEGADEVLLGYPHLRVDAGVAVRADAHRASSGIMLPAGEATLPAVQARLGFVPTFLRAKAEIGAVVARCLRRPLDLDAASTALVGEGLSGAPVEQSLALWRSLALEGYILRTLGDGMEMAHGLEGRLPFLDARVAATLDALPWDAKIRGGVDKAPLRDAMRGRLPDAVCDREKHPFVAPPLEGPLLEVAADAIAGQRFATQPWVDPAAALELLREEGDEAHRKRLDPARWLVASLALWMEAFGG